MQKVSELISFLIPHILESGAYALAVRDRIQQQDQKEKFSGNIFAEVLTDADLSIQNKIEVALLSRFPEIAFYGEEEDKSLNAKYFGTHSDLTVLFDPIDGTRYFVDGTKGFSVILSIVSQNQYEAVIMCVPEYNTTYVAERGKGTIMFRNDAPDERSAAVLDPRRPYVVCSSEVQFTKELSANLTPYDFLKDYGTITPPPSSNSILWGDAVGAVLTSAQAIDALAIGFLVQEAGGYLADLNGNSLILTDISTRRVYPGCVIAATPEAGHQLVAALER